jgi:peptide/nickel transport system ATP-binding protein
MHHGLVVERGTRAAVLDTPTEDYTRTLLAAVPVADPRRRSRRLPGAAAAPAPAAPAEPPTTPTTEESAR